MDISLYENTKIDLIEQREEAAKTLSEFYSSEISNPLYFEDLSSLKIITKNIIQNPQITSAYVLTKDGDVLTDGTDSNLLYSQPITSSNCLITLPTQKTIQINENYICILNPILLPEHIGFLLIHYSLDEVNLIFEEEAKITILSILTLIILLIITFFITNRSIVRPILRLKQATEEITKGNLQKKVDISGCDEIKSLAYDVNKMQDSLEKSQKEIIKNERFSAIGELSSRLAHDIRNPITIIKTAVMVWRKTHKDLTEKEIKNLERIDRATSKIKYLVENVLDFVRSQKPKYEEISLLEIFRNAKNSIHEPKNIKFFVPTNDIKIQCDPNQIEVVLENLMTNSVQAIGDDSGSITISCLEENGWVLILVQDTGAGIPENIISKIFDPLFTNKKEGTGLGLASCKSIIESHHGTLKVFNNPTTFRIKLPKLQEK